MEPLITLKNIFKTYKLDGVEVQALKNINLSIKKKDFIAIMGPSGSGKSTLMNIIGLLDIPTSGAVLFNGEDVSKLNDRERAKLRNSYLGFIFQQFNLLQKISAVENAILPLMYSDTEVKKRKQIGIEKLKLMGLGERLDHRPNQLSGGQQQRVAIARALVNEPQLILADEPTGNIDTKTGKQIMDILKKLNQEGKTIIMVTHSNDIAAYADRTIHIVDGEITK